MILKKEIVELLKKNGAQAAGIFSFEKIDNSPILEKDMPAFKLWLSDKANAEMFFLENNMEARTNPSYILSNVKNAIIFLFPYATGHRVRNKKENSISKDFFQNENSIVTKKQISRYVFGKDYHKVLKKNLNEIGKSLQNYLGKNFSYRPVVDSIPFFDRAHAREACLGFVGKNTMLIRPGMGSFFFIATLLTDNNTEDFVEVKEKKKNPISDLNCGDCTKCLDACPTNAFTKPYFLDANKCLSYLTIEHRGLVPEKYISHFAKTIYGCDVCQEVCPYNMVTSDFKIIKEFSDINSAFLTISVKDIALMSTIQYEQWFGGTAATRAKYQGLVRNALYHLHATSSPDIEHILEKLGESEDELISKTVEQIKMLRKG